VIPTQESPSPTLGYNTAVKQTIFAVEDDADISRLVRHHLEAAGYAVRTFAATAGVVSEAEKQAPTLFLLDIMLPGSDGLELCKRIRQTPALAMIPVIFLTAKVSEADRVMGLELGADDYIPKPFSPREMVARVRAVLRRFERPLVPAIVKAGDIEIDRPRPPSSGCWSIWRVIPDACSRATNCWTRSGATPTTSPRARWTCMCAAFVRRSKPTPTSRAI